MSTLTKADWLRCTKCETPMAPEFWPRYREESSFVYDDSTDREVCLEQIENGLTLQWLGGYGMFNESWPYPQEERSWHLCHDCVITLLELFPESVRQQFVGGHPAHDDNVPLEERCCRYAWCFTDIEEEEQ
jgi:hypothetical protein